MYLTVKHWVKIEQGCNIQIKKRVNIEQYCDKKGLKY